MSAPVRFAPVPAPRHDRHLLLAAFAILVSLGVHILLLNRLADLRLDAASAAIAARRLDHLKMPPLHVERLRADPFRAPRPLPAAPAPPALAADFARIFAPRTDVPLPLLPGPDPASGLAPKAELDKLRPVSAPLVPRQDIRSVLERRVVDELAALPRREVPRIERVPQAPDFAPAADLTARRFSDAGAPPAAAARFAEPTPLPGEIRLPDALAMPEEATPAAWSERFGTNRDETATFIPMDDRLAVAFQVYRGAPEKDRVYFRVAIQPRADRPVPVLPKDIVFVQDASASLAEERLHFCRKAMITALATIGPEDRFNVIGFNDRPFRCFPNWVAVNRDTTNTAARFIGAMHAEGETDLYASLREILNLPRDPQRPVIALVVTDGRPTAGRTESSSIIAEFTRQNGGAVSVFAFGTHGRANTYLLDMLTYCNRGATRIIRGGRWDIPAGLSMLAADFRQPVMHDIRFAFDVNSDGDVHPRLTMNLYQDRPLELFGACPATTRELVFQLRGQAGAQAYDAVFRLDLNKDGQPGSASIRERWAWQKMYSLIGAYAREPRRVYMADLYRLSRDYGLPILYQHEGFSQPPVAMPAAPP
jgi:hypothetical protein